jgi:hypothetical protein
MRSRYSRYRRRAAAGSSASGHTMFGSTGWLFADLLLALAVAFLLATTFGAAPSHSPVVKNSPTASASPTPTPTPTPQPQPALDLNYVTVYLPIDPGDISASSIQQTIMNNPKFAGRQAGLVILFAGGTDPNGPEWEEIDTQVWSILQGMDKDSPLFRVAVPRPFWNGMLPLTKVKLNVYLFKPRS